MDHLSEHFLEPCEVDISFNLLIRKSKLSNI